ncbi:lipopolysaccharide biosynthesis protein [Kocuria turfanensis]|uniref:lipopolysaccharide biosynthesis protein n=1 Tax=Kocuria turfanensis TaxID=388357 RepID=UPI004036D456
MTPQRLARSGTLTFAFVVTGAGLAFAATLVVSNTSGAAAAGQFFQVVAVLAIATTLSTFGADTGLVRSVPALTARGQGAAVPAVLRIAGRPVLVLAAGVAATAAVLALAPGALPDGVGPAVLLAAPFLVLGAVLNLAFGALRGLHRVPTFSFLQNVVLPSLRVLGVLGVVLAGGGLLALTAAWTVPVAVVCVLALVLLHRIVRDLRDEPGAAPPPDTGTQRRAFWSFSSARGVTAVVEALLEWLDVLLVAAFLGPAAAGVYGVVNRCIRVGAMLDHTARIVTGPSISAALAVDDLATARSVFTRTTAVLVAGAWPFYLTLLLFGPGVLAFFGDGFASGYPAMLVIAAAMLLAVSAGGVQSLLLMAGRSRWQLMNKSTALAVAVALNLWLIPQWGLVGAATAWAASVLTDTGLALFQCVRLLGISPRWSVVGAIAAAAAVLSGGSGLLVRAALGPGTTGLLVHLGLTGVLVAVAAAVLVLRQRSAVRGTEAAACGPKRPRSSRPLLWSR